MRRLPVLESRAVYKFDGPPLKAHPHGGPYAHRYDVIESERGPQADSTSVPPLRPATQGNRVATPKRMSKPSGKSVGVPPRHRKSTAVASDPDRQSQARSAVSGALELPANSIFQFLVYKPVVEAARATAPRCSVMEPQELGGNLFRNIAGAQLP